MSFPSRVSYNQESDIFIEGQLLGYSLGMSNTLWQHESLDLGLNGFLRNRSTGPRYL